MASPSRAVFDRFAKQPNQSHRETANQESHLLRNNCEQD